MSPLKPGTVGKPRDDCCSSGPESGCGSGPESANEEDRAPPDLNGVQWRWCHDEKGWLDFAALESKRIEDLYQDGLWMIRVRAGKNRRAQAREVYFWDLVQYNRKTNSSRKIRREPPLTCCGKIRRAFSVLKNAICTGEDLIITLSSMQRRREGLGEERKRRTCWGAMSRSMRFEGLSHVMIIFSAVWIGIDTEYNKEESVLFMDWGWIVMDWFLCIYFIIELIIRFLGSGYIEVEANPAAPFDPDRPKARRRVFWWDKWCLFDCFLVFTNVIGTMVVSLVVVFMTKNLEMSTSDVVERSGFIGNIRLLRVVRLARLFKVVPRLLVLMTGILEALKALMYTTILLFAQTWCFAIIFHSYAEYSPGIGNGTQFGIATTSDAFYSLLTYGVFMDGIGDILLVITGESQMWGIAFIVFVFLANLTMLNLFIGILTEVISRVQGEFDDSKQMSALQEGVQELLECYDLSEDHVLNKTEFEMLKDYPHMKTLLIDNDIDPEDLDALTPILFEDCEDPNHDPKITWEKFMDRVFRLKGGNPALVTDVVELRNFVRKTLKRATVGQLGTTPSEANMGLCLSTMGQTGGDQLKSALRSAGGGSPTQSGDRGVRHFEEQVLAELRALRTDMEDVKSEVAVLQGRAGVPADDTWALPGAMTGDLPER